MTDRAPKKSPLWLDLLDTVLAFYIRVYTIKLDELEHKRRAKKGYSDE